MDLLLKCKKYTFCLNKIKESIKREKEHLDDTDNSCKNFYDELINDDNQIKSYKKILKNVKGKSIKESIYANKQIPQCWKKVWGYNNLVMNILSKDIHFLQYMGHNSANENNRNKLKKMILSAYDKRINNSINHSSLKDINLMKKPFYNINILSSRNSSSTIKLLNNHKKFIRSKSLNNFDKPRIYSSYDKFRNIILKKIKEHQEKNFNNDKINKNNSKNLLNQKQIIINFFKNREKKKIKQNLLYNNDCKSNKSFVNNINDFKLN
jgi:hypothetical protein